MTQSTIDSEVEEYFHYQLVCNFCGRTWWGLHCPHDGYQNPCPSCDRPPIPIKGDCSCVLVAPISTIAQEANKARKELLLKLKQAPPIDWLDANASIDQWLAELDVKITADKEQA